MIAFCNTYLIISWYLANYNIHLDNKKTSFCNYYSESTNSKEDYKVR